MLTTVDTNIWYKDTLKKHILWRNTLILKTRTLKMTSSRCSSSSLTIFSRFFAGKVLQHTVGVPMGTNCAPLLAVIFLYSYEVEFIQSLLSTGKKQLASRFNLTYRYIDDVLSINNTNSNIRQMYSDDLEIKDTIENITSASYHIFTIVDLGDGQLHTSINDKREDFNFQNTIFSLKSSNIPSQPAYVVFVSQLIWYARACS